MWEVVGGKQEGRAWRVIRLNSEQLCLVYKAILTEKHHSQWDSIWGMGPAHNTIQIHPNTQDRKAICLFSARLLIHHAWNHFAGDRHLLAQGNTDLVQSILHVSWAAAAVLYYTNTVKYMQCHRAGLEFIMSHHGSKQYFFHTLRKPVFIV